MRCELEPMHMFTKGIFLPRQLPSSTGNRRSALPPSATLLLQLEMGGSGSPVLVQTELLGPAIIALLQHVNKNEIAHTNQNTASLHQHTSSGAMHLDREHT
jgi:hypothetical protein